MSEKGLGKIDNLKVEVNDRGHFGVTFSLQGPCMGTFIFKSLETDTAWIKTLLKQAKIHEVSDLKNVPIEMEFEDNLLKSWRILEEVL
jgi:hypothetical protein